MRPFSPFLFFHNSNSFVIITEVLSSVRESTSVAAVPVSMRIGNDDTAPPYTAPQLAMSELVTIDQVVTEMGLVKSTRAKAQIGTAAAREYRDRYPGVPIETVEKYVNGEMRHVKAYPRSFKETIESKIRAF